MTDAGTHRLGDSFHVIRESLDDPLALLDKLHSY